MVYFKVLDLVCSVNNFPFNLIYQHTAWWV